MNKMNSTRIISEFYKWYDNDVHSENISFYDNTISKKYLETLNNEELKHFFYEFIKVGGKIQSGGARKIELFKNSINTEFATFKTLIFEPFKTDFNLEEWFKSVKKIKGFGYGISTIYLNRISRDKFPVVNNKTLNALNKLGYYFSSSKNYKNYKKVEKVQKGLIKEFPKLENFYKIDALNHYVVAINSGIQFISDFLDRENLENTLEQNNIETELVQENENVLDKIYNFETSKSETVTIKNKSYKRNNYLMVLIKIYRNYTCQFCSTKIPKSNGEFYIEACHIKAKSEGGKDKLNNILILCPNCHKKFDYGKRVNQKITKGNYKVTLNGETFNAKLK